MLLMILLLPLKNEPQPSINNSWFDILDKQMAMQQRWPIIELSAAMIGQNASDGIAIAA